VDRIPRKASYLPSVEACSNDQVMHVPMAAQSRDDIVSISGMEQTTPVHKHLSHSFSQVSENTIDRVAHRIKLVPCLG
jgi:predicted small metal-binding protein